MKILPDRSEIAAKNVINGLKILQNSISFSLLQMINDLCLSLNSFKFKFIIENKNIETSKMKKNSPINQKTTISLLLPYFSVT